MKWQWAWSEEELAEGSERRAAYAICQERGHHPSESQVLTQVTPLWEVCCYCGTAYREERMVVELSSPGKFRREVLG